MSNTHTHTHSRGSYVTHTLTLGPGTNLSAAAAAGRLVRAGRLLAKVPLRLLVCAGLFQANDLDSTTLAEELVRLPVPVIEVVVFGGINDAIDCLRYLTNSSVCSH